MRLQVLLGDNDAGPHAAHKLVLGHQRSVGVEQHQEKIESAGPQLYRHAFGNQLPLAKRLAYATKVAPKLTIQGGTTEVLRGIIARGLGLR